MRLFDNFCISIFFWNYYIETLTIFSLTSNFSPLQR